MSGRCQGISLVEALLALLLLQISLLAAVPMFAYAMKTVASAARNGTRITSALPSL